MSTIPEHIKIHKQLKKIFSAREKSITTSEGIDWATAEALAFGSLLQEGNHVRLSGQDVQRGALYIYNVCSFVSDYIYSH